MIEKYKQEIINIIDLFSECEEYKDIKEYIKTDNDFYNNYNCQLYWYLEYNKKKQKLKQHIIEGYKWLKKKKISVCFDNIYCDTCTKKYKEYNRMKENLKQNDYILISNLNCLGDGNINLFYENITKEWYFYRYKGIKVLIYGGELNEIISAALPFENTTVSLNHLYIQDLILINIIYKDALRLLEISNTTKAGIKISRIQGKRIGRPTKENSTLENFINVLESHVNGLSIVKATNKYFYPRGSFTYILNNYKKEFNTEDKREILNILKGRKKDT